MLFNFWASCVARVVPAAVAAVSVGLCRAWLFCPLESKTTQPPTSNTHGNSCFNPTVRRRGNTLTLWMRYLGRQMGSLAERKTGNCKPDFLTSALRSVPDDGGGKAIAEDYY
jgi:hypothetical protein